MLISCYLDMEDAQPSVANVSRTVDDVLAAVWQVVQPVRSSGLPCTFSLRFCGDAEIQEVNAQFRGKDKPTNVLSFEGDEEIPDCVKEEEYLGDILLSVETLAREAVEQGKPEADHFKHLLVHSVLHLYGLDHIDEAEAELMEALEVRILRILNVADPYLLQE